MSLKNNAKWSNWNPRAYLNHYFNKLGPDSFLALSFIISELKKLPFRPKKALDFGSGPTIFSSIPLVPYTDEIHVSDYLPSNLQEINKWLERSPDAFNWQRCIKFVLKTEGLPINQHSLREREHYLRKKIKKIIPCDAGKNFPLGEEIKYPLVISTYCIDSATNSKKTWNIYMNNLCGLVAPKGLILLAALRKCKYYKINGEKFPSADLNENDLNKALKRNGFNVSKTKIIVKKTPDCSEDGFSSILLARSYKL